MLDPLHPLLTLEELIPWKMIQSLIEMDLKKDGRGLSRDLNHHSRALTLLIYFNSTYRELVESLRSNIYARVFCEFDPEDISYGYTAYMKFCNELSPSVYEKINFTLIEIGQKLGLTEIRDIDIDSTVKEANITYPTDAKNLKTLTMMIHKCLKYFSEHGFIQETLFALKFDFERVLRDFRRYFFEKDKIKKMAILSAISKRVLILIENAFAAFSRINMPNAKWYIKRALGKIKKNAAIYIKQVQHYCRTGRASKDKILSFHIDNVATIQKGKEHKKYEFGEVWQVGRLDGNFVFGKFSQTDLRFHDSSAIEVMMEALMINMECNVETFAADRGYYSKKNFDTLDALGISEQGIHPKGKASWRITDSDYAINLINRRAGIEPIIGHLKKLGLGKSKMKTDTGTRAEGAQSFIAFNIRKILSGLALT
jgi:IS5 family transposase